MLVKLTFTKQPFSRLDQIESINFADAKLNAGKIKISAFERIENIVGKGENAGYQHFPLFPTLFSKGFFFRVVKSQDCVVKSQYVTC